MERWKVYGKKADFQGLSAKHNIDPVVARIIRNRDVVTDEEFEMYLSDDMWRLHNPWLLKDMDKGVNIICNSITQSKKIRIIGDYDIDGICSIYILYSGLKRLGANVDYVVPDRVMDGYGINDNLVRRAYEEDVNLIITCDNGIAAISQIEYAKSLGMEVVITDHHDVPYMMEVDKKRYIIPPAAAVINPKQEDCEYPFEGICGAMVAYKLMSCIYQSMGIGEEIEEFDEFAAIATVGDVMNLRDENRIIVKNGLKKLAHTSNIGLAALLEACQITKEVITSYDIGFIIGPCLNASGRLDTARNAVELLLSDNRRDAAVLANILVSMNEERKSLTEKGKLRALEIVENEGLKEDKVLVIYLPECHESIAGIIAGRVKEYYNKPSIVLTDSADGGAKGSGRSIETYNMFEELSRCKELFTKFGGHPMAAGLSLPVENIDKLRKVLNDNTALKEEDMVKTVWIDVPMPVTYISEELVNQLKVLEPFGNGNEKPVFAEKNLYVKDLKIIGKNKNVAKMILVNADGYQIDGIYFGEVEQFCQVVKQGGYNSFTYYPSVNEFRGEKNLQIIVTGYI